ncbi:terminase large subunit domain-containing protein [Pseudescherichia vulneris]
MPTIAPNLNIPQARFLALPYKFKAYVAGFGSGKTWVGCGGICKNFWEFPKINQGYFAPTYPQIRDIFYPTVEEVAFDWGLKVKINTSNKEVHFYSGRQYRGTTICRSMEIPDSIVGFKIGNALVDELDVMKKEKAKQAWRKIIARMRYKVAGLRNGIDVTTTPEGYKFVYQQFVKAVRDDPKLKKLYGLVQASTFDNEANLPDDYIDSLLASYPPELIKAYLNGQFTNLASGTIYHAFDRKLNHCNEEARPGEQLFIGMDFNVGKMSAIVHVSRLGLPCAVGELVKGQDTPDMIRMIKERFWLYADGQYKPTRDIYIYPDASGDSRKSVNATQTDIQLLRQAGFNVQVNASNPPVKDRINSMNAMFCNAMGVRRYKVNTLLCPVYTESLEQQVWDDNGEPDKDGVTDHTNDAGGYFIVKQFPIEKPRIGVKKIQGI